MKTKFLVALCAVAMLTAGAVAAQPVAGDRIDDMLAHIMEADVNHDGMITRAEWLDFRAGQFSRFDRNGDGAVSQDDVPALLRRGQRGSRLQDTMTELDANHDGRISRAEFTGGPTRIFDQVDRDHNGVIDGFEIKQAKGA